MLLKRPMLAAVADINKIEYPVMASYKLDGVRCLGVDSVALSRSKIPLPNKHLQSWFSAQRETLDGLDGELIVGDPTDDTCLYKTVSAVMSESDTSEIHYYVFDIWDSLDAYENRLRRLKQCNLPGLFVVPQTVIQNQAQLRDFEDRHTMLGYEGIVIRKPNALYKQGRSTINEGFLLKIKRFADAEAIIIGYEEEKQNTNEQKQSLTGLSKRSSHQENMIGKDRLGSWIVKGLTDFHDCIFRIGSGMTNEERVYLWAHRDSYLGQLIKFKHYTFGAKDAPRNPIFIGFRDPIDL